jgi:hypothetical protein
VLSLTGACIPAAAAHSRDGWRQREVRELRAHPAFCAYVWALCALIGAMAAFAALSMHRDGWAFALCMSGVLIGLFLIESAYAAWAEAEL